MKINNKILSIPPYISTSWNNVSALHMKGSSLIISLIEGGTIEIPNLQPEIIAVIFSSHAAYLERQTERQNPIQPNLSKTTPFISSNSGEPDSPFRLGFSTFDALGATLQHNPAQANVPDLPKEILNKISAIAKIVSPEDTMGIPKPEPHCNCIHCQIAKAINEGFGDSPQENPLSEEETVTAEDLTFCEWDIVQTGDKLYSVTNRLDAQEKYSVYLGHPVGCTCGKQGCEHILAVLKS